MYLKSLELSGFKSFSKKAKLDFNTAITGIVGPNGSGKSNIAEAFRFVLGEQSIKSLRGKKGEDLIWNGGGDAGRANRASVKLTFDNRQHLFSSIEFDEVSIERVVHRDNSNEYILNGSTVRLKDIVELLASAHIGATGHQIISQGEADRILSASFRERREMIEDALGLKIYQWKKLESIRKLEKTEENMGQVASLRREIAPHLKFLKKQCEKVEKAEQMRVELVALYLEYFAHEDFYIKSEKERLEKALSGPKKELMELEKALETAKGVLVASSNKDKKSEEIISLEGAIKQIRQEKDGITRDLGRIEGEISANKRAIEKEEVRIKNEELRMVALKDVEDVVVKIESLKSIEDVKSLFNQVLQTLKDFVARHKAAKDSLLIADVKEDVAKLSKEKEVLEAKLKSFSEKEARQNGEYEELKSKIEKEKDTNRDAEKDVFRIIAKQNEVRNILNGLNTELNIVLHDEETFKRDLGEAGIVVGREAVNFEAVTASRDRKIQQEKRHQIEKIKIRLEDDGGSGGTEMLREYKETEERDTFLGHELEDLEIAKAELGKLIAELDMRIDVEFKSGILKINAEFHKYFTLMFGGGKAELMVVREVARKKRSDTEELNGVLTNEEESFDNESDPDDAAEGPERSEGLDVNISLPRKKIKGLAMLSGGERALTSIALLFAISQVNPPPFIILDETDAALDEANSKKYGDMIESLSKESQLILITHNRETMSHAGVLYGITMGADGASRLLSIAFEEAVAVAK